MEREYFRYDYPQRVHQAVEGLRDWINFYNKDRPHSALGYKAPGDNCPWFKTLAPDWYQMKPVRPAYTAGTVSAIRMVGNGGQIGLWQEDRLRISDALAGQFVRVEFTCTGMPSVGRVVYNRKRGEDIVVATFNHLLDVRGRKKADPLVTNVVGVDFDHGVIKQNQGLDEEQAAAATARVLKRRGKRSKEQK